MGHIIVLCDLGPVCMLSEEMLYNCPEFCYQVQFRVMFFFLLFILFNYCYCVCVYLCEWGYMWKSEDFFREPVFSFHCGILGSNSGHQVWALKLTSWRHLTSPRVSVFHPLSFFICRVRTLPFSAGSRVPSLPPWLRGRWKCCVFLGRNMYLCGLMRVQMTGNVTLE